MSFPSAAFELFVRPFARFSGWYGGFRTTMPSGYLKEALCLGGQVNKSGRAEGYGSLAAPTRWLFLPFVGRFSWSVNSLDLCSEVIRC
jgi:hypothetical protein